MVRPGVIHGKGEPRKFRVCVCVGGGGASKTSCVLVSMDGGEPNMPSVYGLATLLKVINRYDSMAILICINCHLKWYINKNYTY